MTPLSEKAKMIKLYGNSLAPNEQSKAWHIKGFEQGYEVRDTELQAELTRLKNEVEELRLLCGIIKCEHNFETFPSGWYWQKCKKCGLIQPI